MTMEQEIINGYWFITFKIYINIYCAYFTITETLVVVVFNGFIINKKDIGLLQTRKRKGILFYLFFKLFTMDSNRKVGS